MTIPVNHTIRNNDHLSKEWINNIIEELMECDSVRRIKKEIHRKLEALDDMDTDYINQMKLHHIICCYQMMLTVSGNEVNDLVKAKSYLREYMTNDNPIWVKIARV